MRPIHLVLDTSAVVAYAKGSEHVAAAQSFGPAAALPDRLMTVTKSLRSETDG